MIEQVKAVSPQTPAVLISGRVKISERDTLADVFLSKGMYEPVDLLEKIRLLLVRKRGPKRPGYSRAPDRACNGSLSLSAFYPVISF